MAIVELQGLEIFGRHGVLEEEQRDGQPFLYDVRLDVGEAGASDRLDEAVDYRDVVAAIRDLSDARRFDLLEALASEVADTLLRRFPRARWVSVRVRKPQVALPVEWSGVTVERPATR
jgi:7,8-dihydroneopterin aldolase/epimerase/oxygenase